MAAPREFTPEREETPMTDVEAAFERLIECLEECGGRLTDSQYDQLQDHLPSIPTITELGDAVYRLVSTSCASGDFANIMTSVFKEAIQISPENLNREQFISISELLPAGAVDRDIEEVDHSVTVEILADSIKQRCERHRHNPPASQEVAQLTSVLLRKLDTGFTMEQLTMLCEHFDGHETVEPMVMNGRTRGHIIDDNQEVTVTLPFTMPKRLNDLSDDIMEMADKLATLGYTVDDRAWDHLLVYAPQHSQLKKRLKKIEKAVGLTKLRKQIKRVVS